MKYLNRRNDFLKSKITNKIYENTPYSGEEFPIYEEAGYATNHGAGPFHNEIGWNDSLLGRFINHLIRKAKIAGNMMLMKNLTSRLKSEFDSLLAEGYISTSDQKNEVIKVVLYNIFWELTKSIEDGKELKEIKGILKTSIDSVKKLDKTNINRTEKEEILKELDILKEFLDKIKEESIESVDEDETESESIESLYPVMLENLKSLKNVVMFFEGDYKSSDDKNSGGNNGFEVATNENVGEKPNKSIIILKSDIDSLKDIKIKNVSIDSNFINNILTKSESYKKSIIELYKEVNRYLVGDKKTYLEGLPKDKLFENTETPTNIIKNVEGVAWKIAKFSKRAFQAENNYDRLEGLSKPIESFVTTMKKINNFNSKQVVKESISKYLEFIKENSTNIQASELPKYTYSENIKEFFNKNCKSIKDYTMDKTEALKISKNLDESVKKGDFVIPGFDPIIEIVKLFNRAYKIYMETVISKKTNGPSPGTLMEYTPMSSGNSGPWRNNKLFNQWEDAVLNILKDRKYQPIFDKKTQLRVGEEMRPNKGAELRKFMTELLDGDSLYSMNSNGKGSQAKFLAKYFGEPDEKDIELGLTPNESKENAKLEEKVKESQKTLKFKKPDPNFKPKSKPGSIFLVDGVNEDNQPLKRIFLIQEGTKPFLLSYSKSFASYWKPISQLGNYKFDKGDYKGNVKTVDEKHDILLTKSNDFIMNKFKLESDITIGNVRTDLSEPKEDKFKIKGIYFLVDEEDEQFSFSDKDLPRVISLIGSKTKILNTLPDGAVIK